MFRILVEAAEGELQTAVFYSGSSFNLKKSIDAPTIDGDVPAPFVVARGIDADPAAVSNPDGGNVKLIPGEPASGGRPGSIHLCGRLSGCRGTDVASASAIDITDGNYVEITGTTDIDHIVSTGWAAGSEITLGFTANVSMNSDVATVDANTMIELAGGAKFNATPKDNIKLLYTGTVFRELARSKI